ncbi:MAG: SUMF1/EgtB/PvdO family nonheme iron enzyme [Opitutaceae bacterium]
MATVFFSRYRLKTELGRGGMGVVWRAEDTKLHRDVALKFLPELVVRDREAMADLAAETRRLLDLTHPNIVRVYDLVEDGERAAISMELVEGGSLAERKLQQPDRCFTTAMLTPWIAQLCAALDYAHEKVGIVHRDLKPLNLLLNARGDLKIVDFGISRSLLTSGTRLSTDSRAASVSLGYAGPQQLLGETAAVTDDIYSLGASIYELLTGKPPFFEGDIMTQLREVVPPTMKARRAVLGVTGREPIPEEWEETIAACLAKKAADRPRTASEVAERLGLPVAAISQTSARAGSPVARRKRRVRRLLAVAGVLAVAAVPVYLWLEDTPEPVARGTVPASTGIPGDFRGLVVTVTPPDAGAQVWIGKAASKPVPIDGRVGVTELDDGEHELTVRASGYKTFTGTVEVQGGRGFFAVKLEPIYGALLVVGRPGTLVTAVGERGRELPVGTIPASGQLEADKVLVLGTYLFKLTHPDCVEAQVPKASLALGRVTRVAPVQAAAPGELEVFSAPDGAEVSINGVKAGVTPATLLNQPSEKPLAVDVFLAGYARKKQSVQLKPRETLTLDVGTLVPVAPGIELRGLPAALNPPPRGAVRIDGKAMPARKGGRVVGLEVGPRTVEIVHPDYEPWKQTVEVVDGQQVPVPVKLVPKPGELTLAVTPAVAFTLTVGGKPVALTDNRASLPAAEELALEFSASGFKTTRTKVKLAPHGKETLAVTLERALTAEPGQPWTIPGLGLLLLPVAPGSFAMGSEVGGSTERSGTQVAITQPFWLGKTEVTQREWSAMVGGNQSRRPIDDLPVQNVSWVDAMDFCRKLTERERTAERLPPGYIYTLPTEAQWEYACRAGEKGDTPASTGDIAWHEGNSAAKPHPVGTRQPNTWGFYDMLGNVWEWCADWHANKLKSGSVTDPKGIASGTERVRRGGSYVLKADVLRYGLRGKADPEYRTANLGFRLALVPEK